MKVQNSKLKVQSFKQGFSFVELLVVIFIIAVLSAVVLVSLGRARIKSRDNRRKSDLAVIQQALEMYYADEHKFPNCRPGESTEEWCSVDQLKESICGSKECDITDYLSPIPEDPKLPPPYYYGVSDDKMHYILFSNLENTSDTADYNKPIQGYWQEQGISYPQYYYYYVSSD